MSEGDPATMLGGLRVALQQDGVPAGDLQFVDFLSTWRRWVTSRVLDASGEDELQVAVAEPGSGEQWIFFARLLLVERHGEFDHVEGVRVGWRFRVPVSVRALAPLDVGESDASTYLRRLDGLDLAEATVGFEAVELLIEDEVD